MQTRRFVWIPLVAAALLLFAGCSSKRNLVGKWQGSMVEAMKTGKVKDDPAAAMGQALAKAFMGNVTLDLRSDDTFAMQMFFPVEGKWSTNGSSVTLTPTKVMGMDASKTGKDSKPLVLTIEDGGNRLVAAEKGNEPGLAFTRAKAGS